MKEILKRADKNLGKIAIGTVIFINNISALYNKNYGWAVASLVLLIILLKVDSLVEIVFDNKSGIKATFSPSAEKIEEDIRDNTVPVTPSNFKLFKLAEEKILMEYAKRYDTEIKTKVHFMYGSPDKPEFMYSPDGSLQTEDTLMFIEIKYILKPAMAKQIVNKTLKQLNHVYKSLDPSIGDKKFIIKLALASGYDISDIGFDAPEGIEIEYFRV